MPDRFQINFNLSDYKNFSVFERTVYEVRAKFQELFGEDVMNRIPLYVDNSTDGGGYTPITDVVLQCYISIKLCISDFSDKELIVYQFAHEMCHFTYKCLIGINKKHAGAYEESICSAMSLCLLYGNCKDFDDWCKHVRRLKNRGWRKGYDIALECNFSPVKLKDKVLAELEEYIKIAL